MVAFFEETLSLLSNSYGIARTLYSRVWLYKNNPENNSREEIKEIKCNKHGMNKILFTVHFYLAI